MLPDRGRPGPGKAERPARGHDPQRGLCLGQPVRSPGTRTGSYRRVEESARSLVARPNGCKTRFVFLTSYAAFPVPLVL